jgi:PAS domain S-box-containing protein
LPDTNHRPTSDILRRVANNLTEMVMAYDMDRRLVFVNPAAETLTGYSTAELEKDNFICWVHPEDQARMLAGWERLFEGKSFQDEEYRCITKDGRVKWVVSSWRPIFDEAGRQIGVQGREFDVTPRKLAETALRQSEERLRLGEERYRVLFEDSPFPMWEEDFSEVKELLDAMAEAGVGDMRRYLSLNRTAVEECVRSVRILDVNRAARAFYGASTRQELIGGLSRIFDETAVTVFRDEVATLFENNSSFRTEFAVRTLQGEERLVDMFVSIADSARHDWSRVIVSFFDITDRKRLEEQFLQSQKMESVGRLAGGIAHDFNNLLTVINGYTDWVLTEMGPDDPFRPRLSEVRKAGERCAELTSQLLAFSRKQIARPGPLDLNDLVRESCGALSGMLGDDVRITTELEPELGIVEADRSQMHQVLMNLAVNAREAMPAGGSVTIRTRNIGEHVSLEVRDTGQGIEENIQSHLFEPFFTTKRDRSNSGLGLAIVFGVVSNCGGRIEVRSKPGEGAAFVVYLPRAAGGPPRAAETSVIEMPRSRGGRILVVDDREDVRVLTCHMAAQLGYEPLAAASGAEALEASWLQHGKGSLLLTDVVMPGMNGRELAAEMRRRIPGLKTVFMSGHTDRLFTDSDASDSETLYLQKPFTVAQLAAILRRAEEA